MFAAVPFVERVRTPVLLVEVMPHLCCRSASASDKAQSQSWLLSHGSTPGNEEIGVHRDKEHVEL